MPQRPAVKDCGIMLRPDPARTVVRPFLPSDPPAFADQAHPRPERVIARVMSLSKEAMREELDRARLSLDERHRAVRRMLHGRYKEVETCVPGGDQPDEDQQELIGAYLSAEYSFESAALFNPSVVPFPDREPAADGSLRFLVSLRGIGEGHLSSVTFRTGVWNADGSVKLDDASPTAVPPGVRTTDDGTDKQGIILDCRGSREPSETVLFPILPSQSRGIEDLRLTTYTMRDGTEIYAGTFTALGDEGIKQQMLRTENFKTFRMHPVLGDLADAKGMALFPRRIDDRMAAIGRQDNENLWLSWSDDVFTWHGGTKILAPKYPWEFTQMGNCGSPIEIDEGWLLITHGVGVVRNYCIGAALLDRDDPTKVLGRMPLPLLEPDNQDRDGYVPNVVYSCGALARGRDLLLPYGVADNYARFATVKIDEILAAME